jgi:hypothetical protein
VREKLNLRLEDNEPAKELLKWLNHLPQTKKVLKSLFNGVPINKQNLSDWKTGGFRDWQAQQEALNAMQQMADDAEELQSSSTGPLSDKVSTWLLARYFLKLKQALAAGGADELKLLHRFCADVVALRRGDHYSARLKLQEEKLKRQEGESEEAIMEYFYDWVKHPEVNEWIRNNTMTEEEKRRAIQAILFPRRYLDEEAAEDTDEDGDEDADEETDDDIIENEKQATNENQTPSSSDAPSVKFPLPLGGVVPSRGPAQGEGASANPTLTNCPNVETTPTPPAATETTPPVSQGQSSLVNPGQLVAPTCRVEAQRRRESDVGGLVASKHSEDGAGVQPKSNPVNPGKPPYAWTYLTEQMRRDNEAAAAELRPGWIMSKGVSFL